MYIDYGSYEQITNLTNEAEPVIRDGQISWSLLTGAEGFYYRGTLLQAEPPFLFGVQYFIDGTPVKPEDMAGRAGHVRIVLSVMPNPKNTVILGTIPVPDTGAHLA